MSDVLRRIQTVFSIDDNDHNRKLKDIRAEYQLTAEKIKTVDSVMETNGRTVESLGQKQKLMVKSLQDMRDYQTHYENSIKGTNEKLEGYKKKVTELDAIKTRLKRTIEEETKAHGENSEEVREAKAELEKTTREHANYSEQVKRSEASIQKYSTEIEKSKQNQEKYAGQIQKVNTELKKQESQLYQTGLKAQEYGKKLQGVGKGMQKIGDKATMYISAPILAAGVASLKMANDFETAFVGVTKTIDEADVPGGYAAIKESIRTLAKELPATHEQIAGVVEVAGRLGVEGGSIMKFTKVMIDLGETTDMVASQAADSLAKFSNITGMSQKDFDKLGSTIVDLGNNFAASESEIIDMGLRLAAAGTQAGLSESEIMALSAGLTSLGLEAEAGGSAFSKLMVRIKMATVTGGPDLEKLASVAGTTGAGFKKAFEEDASKALMMFIDGLAATDEGGQGALKTLMDLGIEEIRMRDATLRAAGGHDVLTSALEKSGTAWENNSALVDEANKRYASSESQMKISMNRIKDVGIEMGEKILPHVVKLTEGIAELVEEFVEMEPATQGLLIKLAGIGMVTGPVVKQVGNLAWGVGKVTESFGKFAVKSAAATAAQATFIGPMPKAAVSLASLGPAAGIAALGIAGLAAAVWLGTAPHRKYNDNIKETIDNIKDFGEEVEKATPIISNFNDSGTRFDEAIDGKRSKVAKLEPEITKIFSDNISRRNALTDDEIRKVNEYLNLLDNMNDEVVQKYGVRLNIAMEKLNAETKLNENAAKEYMATANLYDSELTANAKKNYESKLLVVQNGIATENALRSSGNYEEAKKQKAHNDAMKIEADRAYKDELDSINEGTVSLLTATVNKYVATNKKELEGLQGLSWIRNDEIKLIKDYNQRREAIENDSLLTQTDKAIAQSDLYEWHLKNLSEHKLRENWVWDKSSKDMAGALMSQVNSVILHGGKINSETSEMVNGIMASMGRTPENAEYFKTMMADSLKAMVEKEPELADEAESFIKNIDEVMRTLPEGKYETAEEMMQAIMNGIKSVGVVSSIEEIDNAINEHLQIMKKNAEQIAPGIAEPLKNAIPTIEEFAASVGKTTEDVQNKLPEIAKQFKMSEGEVMVAIQAWGGNMDEFASMHEANVSRIEESIKSYVEITTNGFTEIEQNSTVGLKTYMKNMEKNQEATRNWSENTQKLMKAGVSEGIIKELIKMGPAGAEQAELWVKQLEKMNGGSLQEFDKNNKQTREFLEKFSGVYTDGLKEANEAAILQQEANDYGGQGAYIIGQFIAGMIAELPYMKEMLEKLGIDVGDYTSRGLEKSTPKAREKAEQYKTEVLDELGQMPFESGKIGEESGTSTANGIAKSRLPGMVAARKLKDDMMDELGQMPFEAEKIGGETGSETADGIKDSTPKARNKAAGLKNAVIDELYPLSKKGKSSGTNFSSGVADGIKDGTYLATAAARKLAARTKLAFDQRLEIYSPSRVMRRDARNIPGGVALGIEDDAHLVEKAMDRLAAIPLKAEFKASPAPSQNVNSSVFSPTVTNSIVINATMSGPQDYDELGRTIDRHLNKQSSEIKIMRGA